MLHFPTPLLAGPQLGLVLGEKPKGGRKKEAMVFAPTSALSNVSGSGCISSIVLLLQDHPSFLGSSLVVLTHGSQEHRFPPLSLQPRIGRHFLLLLLSWVASFSFVWLISFSITCLADTVALYPYPLGVYLYKPKAAS